MKPLNSRTLAAGAILALAAGSSAQVAGDQDRPLTADEIASIIQAQALRTIASSHVPPGYRLVDSDMLLPATFNPDVDDYFQTNTWPGGVVPYTFTAGMSQADQSLCVAAMNVWTAVANISFVGRTNQADYITFQTASFNQSAIGRMGGQQTVFFGSGTLTHIVAHELGHAMGFLHTHQRPDRETGGYVTIRPCNVQGVTCNAQGQVTGSTGTYDNNFPIIGNGTTYGAFDFDSVMAYQRCSFSICCPAGTQCNCAQTSGCETITPQGGYYAQWAAGMGQRDHISYRDGIVMRGLYPYPPDRWLSQSYFGTQFGTFLQPWNIAFASAYSSTPFNGTLLVSPGNYSAVGLYSSPRTLIAPLGATLGN